MFSSIRRNINHGGVRVEVQAPASVSMQDASLPVSVTITASNDQVHINGVRAVIFAQTNNQNFNPNNSQTAPTTTKQVARADNMQPFDLMPNKSQTVQVNIVMNAGSAIESQLPENSAAAGIMHGLKELETAAEILNNQSYTYFLEVSADVEGIKLYPSKRTPLQVLNPNQIGGGFNIHI